jgi:phosphate transport system permease protein
MATPELTIRTQMAAASGRVRRLKRVDRAAVAIITAGGLAVVAAVLGILVFIVSEALPLFRPAAVSRVQRVALAEPVTSPGPPDATGAAGVDEYQRYFYTVDPAGTFQFIHTGTGEPVVTIPVPGVQKARVSASASSPGSHQVAIGFDDGRAALATVLFVPRYEGAVLADLTPSVRERAVMTLDPAGRGIRRIAYREQDDLSFVAALVADGELRCWWRQGEGDARTATVRIDSPEVITDVRVGRAGTLIAGTTTGHVYHWELADELRLTDVSQASAAAITALAWMPGGNSWIVGSADGAVTGWFRAPTGDGGPLSAVRVHQFEPHRSPVVAIATSTRDRSFATVDRDRHLILRHQTSERVLARLTLDDAVRDLLVTPKADGLVTVGGGALVRYGLDNPHPDASWRAFFGKVWYEGYSRPEYVWQSSGATDEFEPKLSLVPLVFGTMKATVYAMLFALPVAVLAALYTSQFTDPRIRAKIKPTVEIMAALPSVVIGFLAGLYLASAVERQLTAVFLMVPLLPLAGMSGVWIWRLLPTRVTRQLRPGTELALILPLLLAAAWLALVAGPAVERLAFGGDTRAWLQTTWGLTYDQRNCLVVGIAMGFAVVPLIFTIAEDAFSSVPASLTAASLALGATRWQTALRVVLPTASPGIFSAAMIGFGRAVGETMIVLMATGNTPLLDWSIFNGVRTLSANIAVEIPEAPHGGTLYRTLFLAAALLFGLTFIVNTVAEIVRQRLRQRYRSA